jgi:mono/diheme cytochrome c family protein
MRAAALVTLILTVMLMVACAPKPESSRGFRLPDGDAAAGRATFVRLNCHGCHEVEGLELPEFDYAGPPLVRVKLGGETTRVRTYGELVTSIINPSHRLIQGYPKADVSRDGESMMADYNDWMTVSQLIDLVAFLQSHYQVVPPDYEYYQFTY